MTLNRHKQPPLGLVENLQAREPELKYLSNGIPVYVIEAGDQDISRVDFIFQAGSRYQEYLFQAVFASSLMIEGTKTRTAREIADALDFYGSYVYPGCDRDEAHVQVYSLDKFLDSTLDIAADVIINPAFPLKELEISINKKLQSLAIENQKVESRARKSFMRTLFGEDHPYGQSGEPEDLKKINPDVLIDFHKSYYQPSNCSIILSGKEAGRKFSLIEERFGGWSAGDKPGILFPTGTIHPPAQFSKEEEVPGAVQTAIRIGCLMPDKRHEDFSALSIANTILGGYFGSRLMQNIREDKGYTYGIGSALYSFKEQGIFLISTDVGLEYYEATLQECYKEIDKICSTKVSANELKRVRLYVEGELLRQLDGPFNLAENFKSLLTYGLDFSFLQTYLGVLNSITPDEIRNVASKYFAGKQFVQIVAGLPKSKIL